MIRGATVLPIMNCVVLYGKTDWKEEYQFHLFKIKGNEFKRVTSFKSMCNHDKDYTLTPLIISGQEHLAASCADCEQIDLYSLKTKRWSVAFKDDNNHPYCMCAGTDNKLYISTFFHQVLELDCSKPKFFGLAKKFTTSCFHMCYLPFPHTYLAIYDHESELIKAFSLHTNQEIWQCGQEIDGKITYPEALLCSARHDALLVADGGNGRILVLDPKNGAHVQTIPLAGFGEIWGIWLYDNGQAIVVHHFVGEIQMISCFSINI